MAPLALAATGAALAYAGTMSAARRRLASSHVLATAFGQVEYAEIGRGEPVLCIHGASGGFDQGLAMTEDLAGRGYRLIAPSRFGYLRSSLPEHPTAALQADAFVALLDRLGVEKAVILGISAGAWSCLQFAARHPERCRALVLLVPANALPEGVSIRGGALARAIFNSDFVAWVALSLSPVIPDLAGMLLGTPPAVLRAASPEERARARRILRELLPVSARAAGTAFDIRLAAESEPCPIERIDCPVLTLSAEDDAFETDRRARSIAAAVRNGRTIIYPTGGHALVGRHDQALADAAAFLRQLAGG